MVILILMFFAIKEFLHKLKNLYLCFSLGMKLGDK